MRAHSRAMAVAAILGVVAGCDGGASGTGSKDPAPPAAPADPAPGPTSWAGGRGPGSGLAAAEAGGRIPAACRGVPGGGAGSPDAEG